MAVKKDTPLQDIRIDPAVQAYLGIEKQTKVNERRVKEMSLTRAQRRKRAKDAARIKATYDLPEAIKLEIEKIATKYDIPKSQIVAFLLWHALRQYKHGDIDLMPYLRPSRVPRFTNFLVLPEESEEEWNLSNWSK